MGALVPVNFVLPPHAVEAIDDLRGNRSRSDYLRGIIERGLMARRREWGFTPTEWRRSTMVTVFIGDMQLLDEARGQEARSSYLRRLVMHHLRQRGSV